MEIRLMDALSFERSKELWKLCFPEDGDGFVNWYYETRTRPEYALGAFIEDAPDEPVSMLHILPKRMHVGGGERSACLVAGVATNPRYRGRGLCTRLFEAAHKLMQERGFEVSVLQPFDTAFYERLGYKTFARLNRFTVSGERLNELGRTTEIVEPTPELLLRHYNEFTAGYNGCSVRDSEYFKGFIAEFSLPGARLIVSPFGYCAGYEDGEDFTAYEFIVNSRDPEALLSMLPKGYERVTFCMPEDADGIFADRAAWGLTRTVVPFAMLSPLRQDFSMCFGRVFCVDRY